MKRSLKLILVILITVIAAYVLLKYVAPLLTPFIIAIFFSLLMEPLVNFFHCKFKIARGWSVLFAMLVFLTAFFTAATLIVRRLIIELIGLSVSLPAFSNDVWKAIVRFQNNFFLSLPDSITSNYPKITDALQSNINSLIGRLQDVTTSLLNSLVSTISGVTGLFIIILVSIIATYFLSRDRNDIIKFWIGVLPEPWGRKSLDILKEIFQALIGYIKAQILLVTITMIITVIGLYLIGAKYALVMGIIIGLFDLLPVLGPGTIHIPWIIFSFIQGNPGFGVKLAILYLVALVVRQITEPKLVAQQIGLHPLVTLMAMYIGLHLLGVPGLILGPLLVITVKSVIKAADITIVR